MDFTTAQGGVMTDEVGVVTGELTMRTEKDNEQLRLRVQYKDADEWYTVTGGTASLNDPAAVATVESLEARIRETRKT